MKPGKKFPKDVIEFWPEVFGEISLNVIPIRYLDTITVTFKNRKIWELKIKPVSSDAILEQFESSLKDILSTYENEIDNVDFKLDTERIKKDVTASTSKFFKKRKLK